MIIFVANVDEMSEWYISVTRELEAAMWMVQFSPFVWASPNGVGVKLKCYS